MELPTLHVFLVSYKPKWYIRLPTNQEGYMADFQAMIEKERERLTKVIEDYNAQIADLQTKVSAAQTEMAAIDAYDRAKRGELALAPKAPRTPRATTTDRAPRGSKRDELIALIRDNPNLSRGDILGKLGIVEKDNKAAAQSVSNALANLKKAGTVLNEGGKYRLPPT